MPVVQCYQVQVPFESAMSIGENSEATKYYKGDIFTTKQINNIVKQLEGSIKFRQKLVW